MNLFNLHPWSNKLVSFLVMIGLQNKFWDNFMEVFKLWAESSIGRSTLVILNIFLLKKFLKVMDT